MNDTTQEQLSALMDGELPHDELRFLLRRIESDAGLAQRWSRYQIASAVLKRQYAGPLLSDGQFATAVIARLDSGAVSARQPMTMTGRLLRWAGGGAIAASVAVLALVATRPAGTDGAMPTAPAIAAVPAASQPTPPMEMRQPLLPQQVLPAGFSDSAQPASFESIVPTYTYAPTNAPSNAPKQPRNPAVQSGNGLSEAFVPYVLVVGARQTLEPQPQPQRDAPSQQ
jgi:sigma-E factor negative regulatory protein RseA